MDSLIEDKPTQQRIQAQLPTDVDYCSFRYVNKVGESIVVNKEVVQPIDRYTDTGYMITVVDQQGIGYVAGSDLTPAAIDTAIKRAKALAIRCGQIGVYDFGEVNFDHAQGQFKTPVTKPVQQLALQDRIDLLVKETAKLKQAAEIVSWYGSISDTQTDSLLLTNRGGRVQQSFSQIVPNLWVTAFDKGESQTRSLSGGNRALQGGGEVVEQHLVGQAERLAEEVMQLLHADNCPEETLDLLLMPDQMMLQIHESIGHPLELDRILGDERNYAGTSFVTQEMVGAYQYGSSLLNVSYDPTQTHQFASYGYDDEGTPAQKQLLIEQGKLKRLLGGKVSQTRATQLGVANARAQSWNRPPLDRMANLNVEPGEQTLEEMIAGVERGILMESNRSWSIDDSRNKFQFGCEYARLIEQGQLTKVVKNPNYRGVSSAFWRSLSAVGKESDSFGTHWCGKAEPNQIISVGHASPPCLFSSVEVFGG